MAKTKCDMTIRYCIITTWHWDTTAWHTWQCDATQRSDTAMWHYNKVTQQNEASLQYDTTMKWHSKIRHHWNVTLQWSDTAKQCITAMWHYNEVTQQNKASLQWSNTAKQGITAMTKCDETVRHIDVWRECCTLWCQCYTIMWHCNMTMQHDNATWQFDMTMQLATVWYWCIRPITGNQGNDLTGPRWRQSFSYAEERERGDTADRERSVGSRNILECPAMSGTTWESKIFPARCG